MSALAASAAPQSRKKFSANDRINVAHVGVGGRGSSLMRLTTQTASARVRLEDICTIAGGEIAPLP